MNNFKLLRGEDKTTINLTPIFINPTFQNEVEFCFQFDEEEPISFGTGTNDLHIHISPTPNGNITFTSSEGRTFKIFARERQ
jgi:hypothetical protein